VDSICIAIPSGLGKSRKALTRFNGHGVIVISAACAYFVPVGPDKSDKGLKNTLRRHEVHEKQPRILWMGKHEVLYFLQVEIHERLVGICSGSGVKVRINTPQ
jgi:hypothetical protein